MKRGYMHGAVLSYLTLFLLFIVTSNAFAADSEDRKVNSFDGVKVSGPVKLYLNEGSSERVKVTVEGIELEKVITEVSGNELEVKPTSGIFTGTDVDIKVFVTYRTLREVHSAAAAEVYSETVIKGDKLEVEVSTSARADIRVDLNKLECSVASTGALTISGRVQSQESTVNTGGKLRAFELLCNNAYIKIGSGGEAQIYATDLIEGSVKPGGSLQFKGNPKKERVEKSTGGKIKEIL